MENKAVPSKKQKIIIDKYNSMYDDKMFEQRDTAYNNLKREKGRLPGASNYNNIINSTIKLIGELDISDSFLMCQTITYLLWLGYFSINKEYSYSADDYVIDNLLIGTGVMYGKAKCVNNSYFLRDVLNGSGIRSFSISTNVDGMKKNGHSIVSFYNNDDLYFCDPTNIDFLYFYDFLKVKGFEKDMFRLKIREKMLFYTEYLTKEDLNVIMEGPFRNFNNPIKTIGDIKLIKNESSNCIQNNVNLINDFYDEIHGDIEIVCKNLVKKR